MLGLNLPVLLFPTLEFQFFPGFSNTARFLSKPHWMEIELTESEKSHDEKSHDNIPLYTQLPYIAVTDGESVQKDRPVRKSVSNTVLKTQVKQKAMTWAMCNYWKCNSATFCFFIELLCGCISQYCRSHTSRAELNSTNAEGTDNGPWTGSLTK